MKNKINGNDTLKKKGYFLTAQRRLLLDLIQNSEGHLDVKELYRRAVEKDRSISQATVYRNLNLFKELKLVDEMRLDGIRCYYEIKSTSNHQHLICQGCGKILEFQSPHFEKLIETVKQEYGFLVTKAELYLEGSCEECKDKANNS